ncbi:hypothetical protein [Aliiroseovarius sp. 2305UL8-7]|uniref:hypothetical protein n=1 Tax=Aliiroseovarius conchicola TaxID=3121637 RepID=UPI0035284B93
MKKVILKLPLSIEADLSRFVETCIKTQVKLIAIWGAGAAAIEDEIDSYIVSDGMDPSRFIITTSHELEDFDEVVRFVASFRGVENETPSIVEL